MLQNHLSKEKKIGRTQANATRTTGYWYNAWMRIDGTGIEQRFQWVWQLVWTRQKRGEKRRKMGNRGRALEQPFLETFVWSEGVCGKVFGWFTTILWYQSPRYSTQQKSRRRTTTTAAITTRTRREVMAFQTYKFQGTSDESMLKWELRWWKRK